MNTQTGQHARDLPQEPDDEVSDGDLAGLTSQSSSRSGTSAGLGLSASERSGSSQELSDPAGFGILKRSGTPEPWVKKLADDGMSYYYWNRLNGQIEWTRPEPDPNAVLESTDAHDQSNSLLTSSTLHGLDHGSHIPNRLRSESSVSESKKPGHRIEHRLSAYSDDSDTHFFDPDPIAHRPSTNGNTVHSSAQRRLVRKPHVDQFAPELTSVERLAQSLQQALTPPPPEILTDLSDIVRKAIVAVLENVQSTAPSQQQEDHTMDNLVNAVVLGVRNLLYISAAPSYIPNNLFSREARDPIRDNTASQTLLKPAQRKVTATLSKLVLSARAMQYDSGSSTNNTPNRIEGDAEDLERAVIAFVLAVERCRNQEVVEGGQTGLKRLRGVFSTANIGLGLVGAGAAGSWKGFGWVALHDDDQAPKRMLGTEVLGELEACLLRAEEQFSALNLVSKNLGVSTGKTTHMALLGLELSPHMLCQ